MIRQALQGLDPTELIFVFATTYIIVLAIQICFTFVLNMFGSYFRCESIEFIAHF